MASQAELLRRAIENLIDAKLVDILSRPEGLHRLIAHRTTGVASPDVRNAERRLQNTLQDFCDTTARGPQSDPGLERFDMAIESPSARMVKA